MRSDAIMIYQIKSMNRPIKYEGIELCMFVYGVAYLYYVLLP